MSLDTCDHDLDDHAIVIYQTLAGCPLCRVIEEAEGMEEQRDVARGGQLDALSDLEDAQSMIIALEAEVSAQAGVRR